MSLSIGSTALKIVMVYQSDFVTKSQFTTIKGNCTVFIDIFCCCKFCTIFLAINLLFLQDYKHILEVCITILYMFERCAKDSTFLIF